VAFIDPKNPNNPNSPVIMYVAFINPIMYVAFINPKNSNNPYKLVGVCLASGSGRRAGIDTEVQKTTAEKKKKLKKKKKKKKKKIFW
jgi:hypothetical protein